MGWLKPAESLLEPKGIWEEAHRDPAPDGPVPEPEEGVVALGKTVRGVRLCGKGADQINELDLEARKSLDCEDCEWLLDERFNFVPTGLLLGVPLMFKRLELGEGADREELRYETKMFVYKLMTTPGLGLPITWNQNGAGTPVPPIAVCRSDGEPFTSQDWACLCEFYEHLDENYVHKEHLWYTNKVEFKKWAQIWVKSQCYKKEVELPCAFPDIAPCLEYRFPLGIKVMASGLAAKPELNGRIGTVVKYDAAKLRVGVEFAAPFGLLSLKHSNLGNIEDGAAERSSRLLKDLDKKGKEKPKG
mmetsp:Transcript_22978/g.58470  ORF Transcript_22978/g.58470 Transcript_22978/m.58470 type:complete len:303 (+) Transcript_22978:103-1011(+)